MPISYRGYDLYIKDKKGEWVWAASGATKPNYNEDNLVLIKNMAPGEKACILYLPIYSEISSCKIGVPVGSYIRRLDGEFRHKIVFHGSSNPGYQMIKERLIPFIDKLIAAHPGKPLIFQQTNACEKDSHEYSVDGVHPDDHGYYLWSKSIEKPILAILAKYGIK